MIIARINDYEITDTEFQAELTKVLDKMCLQQPTREARQRAIEQLIDGYLLLREARTASIEITSEEIEDSFIDFTLQFNSREEYKSALERFGLDENVLRERIRDQLTIKRYIDRNFPPEEDFPLDKLQSIYSDNKEAFVTEEMVKASHILVKGDDEDTLIKANKIKQEIKSPEDFFEKARECSDCPSCCKSGNLGYFPKGKMVREFEDVAFKLEINQVSDPVRTKFGYHLIMVTDHRDSRTAAFDDVKDALKKRLQKIDSELKLIKHLKELRSKADITVFTDLS